MHLTAVGIYYLRVLDAESGLWTEMKLDQRVSPLSLEAMNLILLKDGILAYIAKRSEFGIQESELEKRRARDGQRCWNSFPASTILSKLGLCQNTLTPDQYASTGHGSPLVGLVSALLHIKGIAPSALDIIIDAKESGANMSFILNDFVMQLNIPVCAACTDNDWTEAISYFKE
jgi:hypothetical protein